MWALIRLARLRDPRTETVIWTTVLIAALSMPLLSQHLPGPVLTVPHLPAATPESATALRFLAVHQASPPSRGRIAELALMWLVRYGQTGLLGAYAVGLLVCLTRLLSGLLLTLRLYRRAVPVDADWANGRNIRASIEVKTPVSVAGAILLPVDYDEWSAAKRNAVLAHEEAHIARGDFFVQLAALIHCGFFWFSPFAWWLQSKLAEIAETASDEAAILRLNDRVSYAEILVEVAHSARKTPAIIAMAKGSFIEKRVEHILSETPNQNLSLPLRILTIVALAGIALALASAKAAVSPMMAAAVRAQVVTIVAKKPVPTPSPKHTATETITPVAHAAHRRARLRTLLRIATRTSPTTPGHARSDLRAETSPCSCLDYRARRQNILYPLNRKAGRRRRRNGAGSSSDSLNWELVKWTPKYRHRRSEIENCPCRN